MKRTGNSRPWSLIGAVVLASTFAVGTLQAQANPIAFGVVGGALFPLGDFGDSSGNGWHLGGVLQWDGPTFPLGIRGEVVYNEFGSKGVEDVHVDILAATVNGVWMFPMTAPTTVRPYIIGGGGLYRDSCSGCIDAESHNRGGLNIGAGIQVPLSGFTSIIEARWHMVFDTDDTIADDSNTTFIPISVGLLFR